MRKDLPWTHAAIIGCSVATGVGAVIRHANVQAGSSVLVVGCGGVGLNVVQGAKLAGASTIIACDLLDNKLEYAKEFGATHTINAKTEDVVKRVQELTGGSAPTTPSMPSAARRRPCWSSTPSRRAATPCSSASRSSPRAPIAPVGMVYGEKKLTGTYYGSIRPAIDFGVLADLDMDKRIDLDSLISRTYKFDEINEGFQLMLSGGVARGVIDVLDAYRAHSRSRIAPMQRQIGAYASA